MPYKLEAGLMRILVVEDEQKLANALKEGLQAENHSVDLAHTGEEGFFLAETQPFDLLLLDVMLPGRSGTEILAAMRQRGFKTPVLMLTARDTVQDRVLGLDSGADDYLTKPFDTSELLARLRVLIRRKQSTIEAVVIRFGSIQMDLNAHVVTKGGQEVRLTAMEYALLHLLITNRGKIVMHKNILRELWGPRFESHTNYLRVYMRRLRLKLEDNPEDPRFLITVSGFGYRLNDKELTIENQANQSLSPT